MIVYDTKIVNLTRSYANESTSEELGSLGYKVMTSYVHDGEAFAVMQREREGSADESYAVAADITDEQLAKKSLETMRKLGEQASSAEDE